MPGNGWEPPNTVQEALALDVRIASEPSGPLLNLICASGRLPFKWRQCFWPGATLGGSTVGKFNAEHRHRCGRVVRPPLWQGGDRPNFGVAPES